MKKLALILTILIIIMMSANAFPYAKTMDGKIGTGYASDPEKFGWQLNFAWLADLDPFFALGFEPGFYWATWEKKVSSVEVGEVGANVKADSDAYIIPVLADAQIRLPNLQNRLHVIPYVTLGLGYSFMILHYTTSETATHDSESKTKFFHGFTWQLMLGMAYSPGQSSKIDFIAEVGYRGAKLSKGNLEIDMSGIVFNIGVRYPLGESEPVKSI
jgi:opacity protein-like surface antigen